MHLPPVFEGTVSNLHRSLVESRMEGGDGRRTILLLSTLTQDPAPSPALLSLPPKSKGHLTRKGEKILKPCDHQSCKKTQVKNLCPGPVLPACSARSPFHANNSTCRPLFQKITRKNLESQKKIAASPGFAVFLPAQLQLQGVDPIAQSELTLPFSSLFYFAL